MLVIHSSRKMVQDVIASVNEGSGEPEIEVACYNAPSSQVVVGSSLAIDRTESLLNSDPRFSGTRSQRLDVTHGFHSKFTTPILNDLDKVSESLTYSKPEIPLETCTAEPSGPLSAARPSQHARESVYFSDAVQRVEKRLGPCIWLEAGMDSPIIPMIKRTLATPDEHVYQAIKMSDSQKPTKLLSDVTGNIWREGIWVSYWNFLKPRRDAYKQIWLPPYQFQPTGHWLQNVDRVIEAQKTAVIEKPTVVVERQELKAPLKLVNPGKVVNKNDRSRDFEIYLGTRRFTDIVSGHAVRQRPLCPASMYMECAAMGVQLLQGPFEAGTLRFLDLSFQAALGVDLAREASLTLEKTNDAQVWSFLVKSFSKTDPKQRVSLHAKGKIMVAAQPDFRTYERLIADRISELENKPNTEKLMCNRAYGLFSQVVHYADFLQGISHIILDKAEAIAHVDLSDKAIFGLEESTVTQYCDTIVIDTFIQVVGLLINSSTLVTSEDVYVATGVDYVSMSSVCDFHNCRSWTVYAKYTTTGKGQAAGDIFAMTRDGALAMIITGAQFTKLLISKLEKFLDSANAKPSQVTAVEKKILPPPIALKPADTASTATSSEGTETPPNVDDSSRATTPDITENGAEQRLQGIIASYTGLSPAELSHDADIGDLGVDSLAAVELAEELQSQFGKEISAEDLLISSYGALLKIIVPFPSTNKTTLPSFDHSGSQAASKAVPSSAPMPSTEGTSSSKNNQGRQVALNLLSETSGASIASIEGKATLEELGIDSLSAVELKGDLEDAFGIEIEDDRFTLESTVKEVLDFLGVGIASQGAISLPAAAAKPTTQAAQDLSSRVGSNSPVEKEQAKKIELASPMEALIECEASFDKAAAQRGFLHYWAETAQSQDELLLAYICEAFRALGSDIGRIPRGEQIPSITHLPKHKKVMNRLLDILEKHDLLTREGSTLIRSSRQSPSTSPQELHEQFIAQFPQYAGEARLMALTGPKLAECLTGKTDPIGLMFRGATAQKVMEDYYCRSPMLSTLTEQIVTFLRTVLTSSSASSKDSPIKILEVGAGFGGTTTRLAEVIEASGVPVSYTFTDISSSLVKGAKSKFARYPWMEYQPLNLENEMPDSLRNRYHIVIGTNCVHATTNKTKVIGRLKTLLNAQGFIVLSEVTQLVDWYDIVFGLLDGWWLANDGSTYPLQPPESWVRSFETAGFANANISYSRGPSPESNTQRLLVASNNSQKVNNAPRDQQPAVQTVVYKEVDDTQIEADIYLPARASSEAMPVGIHHSPN